MQTLDPETSQQMFTKCAEGLTVWCGRRYVAGLASGEKTMAEGAEIMARLADGRCADERSVIEALRPVLNILLVSTHTSYVLHQESCACLSPHENALLLGQRELQMDNTETFRRLMSSVLPAAAIREIQGPMAELAAAMLRLQAHYAQQFFRDNHHIRPADAVIH
ncbi:MAG: hypothetical protein AAGE43_06185 [Pseudomonadota bacterium]